MVLPEKPRPITATAASNVVRIFLSLAKSAPTQHTMRNINKG